VAARTEDEWPQAAARAEDEWPQGRGAADRDQGFFIDRGQGFFIVFFPAAVGDKKQEARSCLLASTSMCASQARSAGVLRTRRDTHHAMPFSTSDYVYTAVCRLVRSTSDSILENYADRTERKGRSWEAGKGSAVQDQRCSR
jgi:hypothetical protein